MYWSLHARFTVVFRTATTQPLHLISYTNLCCGIGSELITPLLSLQVQYTLRRLESAKEPRDKPRWILPSVRNQIATGAISLQLLPMLRATQAKAVPPCLMCEPPRGVASSRRTLSTPVNLVKRNSSQTCVEVKPRCHWLAASSTHVAAVATQCSKW